MSSDETEHSSSSLTSRSVSLEDTTAYTNYAEPIYIDTLDSTGGYSDTDINVKSCEVIVTTSDIKIQDIVAEQLYLVIESDIPVSITIGHNDYLKVIKIKRPNSQNIVDKIIFLVDNRIDPIIRFRNKVKLVRSNKWIIM
jgi:hypothetical protein